MKYKIEKQFIIALLKLPKIKRKTAYNLLNNLDRDILSIGELIEYIADKGSTKLKEALSIDDFATALKTAYSILEESANNNIKMVSVLDDDYPKLLRTIDDPPIILNYIGDIRSLTLKPTICVVGTRNPSAFGEKYSLYVAGYFSKRGFNVISGLALGCDTAAHIGCLNANGTTCAVLAHGLDTIYPRANEALAEQIKESGVIVSEYFVGTSIAGKQFIDRNRIQAGLALGIVIIESKVDGGTMHTANYAFAYERILTCMRPPFENEKEVKTEGNKILTRSGKASPIFYDTELEELMGFLKIL
jgi:DNA processing protein